MSLELISRIWRTPNRAECLLYWDRLRNRWHVHLLRGKELLHYVEVSDLASAYETARRWQRDQEWLAATD